VCGIFGVINFSRLDESRFGKSIRLLDHRGPDSLKERIFSRVALGFTRLAIQDLSSAGDQPMSLSHRSIHIVFNGEIYNYRILREELKKLGAVFTTKTDTEVILNAYYIWGWEKTLEKLEGMFGLGLFDEPRGVIYLARDRFGMKPLFFSEFGNGLVFASEIKAILSYTEHREFNLLHSLNPIFTTGLSPRGKTMFDSVNELEAGHFLRFDLAEERYQIKEYFHLSEWIDKDQYDEISKSSQEEVLRRYENALQESVELHLLSDAPLGVLFSAGLDSSLIAATASGYTDDKLSLFYFESDSQDDIRLPQSFIDNFDAELFSAMGEDRRYIYDLPKMTYHYETVNKAEGPVLGNLCKLARNQGFKTLLTGDSADEIFGGQLFHSSFLTQSTYFHNFLSRNLRKVVERVIPHTFLNYTGSNPVGTHYFNFPPGINFFEVAANCLFHGGHRLKEWQRCLDAYDFIEAPATRDTSAYILDEVAFRLQRFMIRSDRFGMMESVELRTPFLHPSVMKLAVNTPINWFIKKKWMGTQLEKKHILRKLAARAGVPRSIIYRKKIGTPLDDSPVQQILKGYKMRHLSEFLKIDSETLSEICLNSFDPALNRIQFGFLSAELLARMFIDGESHEDIAEDFKRILESKTLNWSLG